MRKHRCFSGNPHLVRLSILALLCLLAPQLARSQQVPVTTDPPSEAEDAIALPPAPVKQPIASSISVMGMVPDGDYRLFSATLRCTAWTLAIEYDRHSWGHFLKSQVDYVVEVQPYVRLSQPAVSDFWGNGLSPNQEVVHGLAVSPFGFRFLWGRGKPIEPYLIGKLGAIAFTKKAFSQSASYANFNIQTAFGLQLRLTQRVDLRVEPFEFYHVSNGYLAASNPGMDELATRYGFTYRLGKQGQ